MDCQSVRCEGRPAGVSVRLLIVIVANDEDRTEADNAVAAAFHMGVVELIAAGEEARRNAAVVVRVKIVFPLLFLVASAVPSVAVGAVAAIGSWAAVVVGEAVESSVRNVVARGKASFLSGSTAA